MERKTKIAAEDGKQEIIITREFELPVDMLFMAYTTSEIVEQWMGNKVLKMENKAHGGYAFEVKDPSGNVLFKANGAIHTFEPDKKITRTFQMENTPFDVQLEFLEFEKLTDETSKLTMHVIYRSVELRDQQLKLPFAQGINMAHDRLQELLKNSKTK